MLGLPRDVWRCPLWENVLCWSLNGRQGASWQQVSPDGEPPPATALKGTIWLMVSLVMAVEARGWRRKG